MQLSAKTQNACLAMMELARRYGAGGQPVSLKTIAEEQKVSSQFLVQILLQLKRAGLVQSVRGSSGGYRLGQDPSKTTLLDIVHAMEGDANSPQPEDATPEAQILHDTWQQANEAFQECLTAATLAELLERAPNRSGDMYYI